MAMRIRSMSAGRAGASIFNANVNGDQGGGDKKQGLAPTTNKRVKFVLRAIKRRADSDKDTRRMVHCINQLGGIGRPSKMFATTADAVSKSCKSKAECHNFVLTAYRKYLNRGADESGLKKYTAECLQFGQQHVIDQLKLSPEYQKLWKGSPPASHA